MAIQREEHDGGSDKRITERATAAGFRKVGVRIAIRLHALGYWPEGRDRPEVGRFSGKHGYNPAYVYHWLKGREPKEEYRKRLSTDLGVCIVWLLHGEEGIREALAFDKQRRRRRGHGLLTLLVGGLAAAGFASSVGAIEPLRPIGLGGGEMEHYVKRRPRRRWRSVGLAPVHNICDAV